MQLSDIRTEVRETAGIASTDPRLADANLNRIINRALRRVTAENDWPWNQAVETITTAADDAEYTAPTAYMKSIRLRYEGRDLTLFEAKQAQQYVNPSDSGGSPIGYYVEQDLIHIVPIPDGVYSIEHVYQVFETALSANGDTPNLPDTFIDYLVAHCHKLIATKIRDETLFAMAKDEIRDWQKRTEDDRSRTQATPRMRTRQDWRI